MSQTHEILEALKAGDKLTHLEAERRFNCARLAARIDDIRKMGIAVSTVMVTVPSGKRVAQYQL